MKYKIFFITAFLLFISIFSLGQFTYAAGYTQYDDENRQNDDENWHLQDGSSKKPNSNQSSNSNKENTNTDTMGIDMDCLKKTGDGKCSINIYKMIGIRKESWQNPEVETFVQDIVLSATMFFWTVFTLVVFFSGFLYILSAVQGADSLQSKAKKGIIWWAVGFLLVTWAFSIVRLIQFLAKGVG